MIFRHADRIAVLILLLSNLSGCSASSTVLINPKGEVSRCSSQGHNLPGIVVASNVHDSCVRDLQKAGFVPIPNVDLGIQFDTSTTPPVIIAVTGSAVEAGIQPQDLLLSIEGMAVSDYVSAYSALKQKTAGGSVLVKIQRNGVEMAFSPVLTPR